MEDQIKENWYYAIIQEPGSSTEQFVGFSDSDSEEKFIPIFSTKDDAQKCFALMPKDLFNGQYDLQAVIEEDLMFLERGEQWVQPRHAIFWYPVRKNVKS